MTKHCLSYDHYYRLNKDFPGSSEGKASACNVGDLGSTPGSGRSPGEWNGNPLQYFCLENPMDRGAWTEEPGQRSLVGYSPWGCKESNTTDEQLHFFSFFLSIQMVVVIV